MKIHELVEEINLNELEHAVFKVVEDCKPFLRELGFLNRSSDVSDLVYRGLSAEGTLIQKTPRVDRKPKSTSKAVHELVDDWFKGHFGFRYRSKGVFATGSIIEAASYGRPYTIFPIGNFDFVWSPQYKDLFPVVSGAIKQTLVDNGIIDDGFISWLNYSDALRSVNDIPKIGSIAAMETLNNGGYTDENLKAAIASRNEIMFRCNSYYGIFTPNQRMVERIIKLIKGAMFS